MVQFTRQLGAQSGTQLNPLQDDSVMPTVSNYDQVFAVCGRFTRGRIDKAFSVSRGNFYAKLGPGEQMRVNALNESWVHIWEALNNGAYLAVVSRLIAAPSAQFVATFTSAAPSTITVTSVTSGTLVSGSPINGPYIPDGTTYTFGTFTTASGIGTLLLSNPSTAPTGTTAGVALNQGGSINKNIVAFNGSGVVLGTPTVSGGALATIPVTNGGSGFYAPPQIIINGVGSGASAVPVLNSTGGIASFTITGGTGYTTAPTVTVVQAPQFAVLTDFQLANLTIPYVFAIKHLGCHNDGIQVNWRAEQLNSSGSNVANSIITLNVLDSTGNLLHSFTGSLVSTSLDDYGDSNYLPNIIANQTDAITIAFPGTPTITAIQPTSLAYGYSATTGNANLAQSGVLVAFLEGGTTYAATDYQNATNNLLNTPLNYGYISSGGTQSPTLLGYLANLVYNTNTPMAFDVPGNLTLSGAIAFVNQLNFGANLAPHLLWAYWAPFTSLDPTGLNGKTNIGVATLNIALACGRNAVKDSNGFAKKNYPVAGRGFPINRSGITQQWWPDAQGQGLNSLALAKINPCIFAEYSDASLYVFFDSLTQAPVNNSERKLVAVGDMSADIDYFVVSISADIKQLPIKTAINRASDALRIKFKAAQAAGWIVPSSEPFMAGQAYKFTVTPNAARPYDAVDINYWLRYDGTTREIFATQTLVR